MALWLLGVWLLLPALAVLFAIVFAYFCVVFFRQVRRLLGNEGQTDSPESGSPAHPELSDPWKERIKFLYWLAVAVVFPICLYYYIDNPEPYLFMFGGGAIIFVGGIPSRRLLRAAHE